MRKLKAVLLSVCLPVGMLGGVGALSVSAPTVASAGPPPPTDPCGSWTATYNSYIYVESDPTWPWYGANGNYPGYPITENQTPSGDPGYGWGPYQHFTVCTSGSSSGDELLIWSEAAGNVWVGADDVFAADSPGQTYEVFRYNCNDIGGGDQTTLYSTASSGLVDNGFVYSTGLDGIEESSDITSTPLLIHGVCGD